MMGKSNSEGVPDDVMELARMIAELPPNQRQHIMRVARLVAAGEMVRGDKLVSWLLAKQPISKRYREYERRIRKVQRDRRYRDG